IVDKMEHPPQPFAMPPPYPYPQPPPPPPQQPCKQNVKN
ncbi:hypothetical protein RF55_18031, partial [Lasius niger]